MLDRQPSRLPVVAWDSIRAEPGCPHDAVSGRGGRGGLD
ncbi:hypothetical protein UO65_4510 [Actinokineospora spheciospongiae]|uniref:Uncharacterized protein n=1 Tax=Actinokineospora spheciospongiae TaxID=909613 RepID=W7IIX8_9PSEU|nr:hypothetical protein UO65_4510 [Actinokineospora spheciospongiae]